MKEKCMIKINFISEFCRRTLRLGGNEFPWLCNFTYFLVYWFKSTLWLDSPKELLIDFAITRTSYRRNAQHITNFKQLKLVHKQKCRICDNTAVICERRSGKITNSAKLKAGSCQTTDKLPPGLVSRVRPVCTRILSETQNKRLKSDTQKKDKMDQQLHVTKYRQSSAMWAHICKSVMCLLLVMISNTSSFRLDKCNSPLGMESGSIKDKQITASSSYDLSVTGPSLARLNVEHLGGAWCPKGMVGERNIKHFLQIDLQTVHVVSAVITQGRFGNGQGVEYVEHYLLEYWRPGFREWKIYKLYNGSKILSGNINTYISVTRTLVPPIIASKIRFIPHSMHPRTVCMRTEIVGCLYTEGVVSYSMPQGTDRGLDVELLDASYDGIVARSYLTGGLGQLMDGVVGDHNFRANLSRGRGYEWVGWKNESGDPLEIIFHFLEPRNFTLLALYTSNMFSKEVEVFSKAMIWFSIDGRKYDSRPVEYTYMRDLASEYARNVTINLKGRTGSFVKIQLFFTSRWLMISEIFFQSEPVTEDFLKNPSLEASNEGGNHKSLKKDIVEGATENTWDDSSGYVHDSSKAKDTHKNLVKEIQEDDSRQKHVALVIGVLVVVILVLMGAILFIYWKTKKQKSGVLSHDLLPGPFSEKRDIVSLKDVQKFLTPPVLRPSFCPQSPVPTNRSSFAQSLTLRSYGQQVGLETGNTLTKNGLYAEPFHVSYGSTYSTAQRLQRTLPGSSPDYTECGSTEYAIPHPVGSSESSPYHNLLPHLQPSPSPHLASFINTSTPPPMSPHISITGDKSSDRVFLTSGNRPAAQENFYATTDLVKANKGDNTNSIQGDGGSYGDEESISSSLGTNFPPEIPRHKIKFLQQIGEGQFGEVHLGKVEDDEGHSKLTAVKTLRLEASPAVRRSFEREVDILGRLRDVNIVGVIGVCSDDEPLCMIVEYCEHGDLNQYLQTRVAETVSPRSTKARSISYGTLIFMATQISSGMKYLESLNFVHRDLATRNCLVGPGSLIKICDFGMSRPMYASDYYKAEGKILVPIRWMAWEPLLLGKFTTKSDVWAFAVTLWEILTMAREHPFDDMNDEQVIENISYIYHNDVRKVTLSIPPGCPKEIYDLMRECWKRSDVDRPSFKEIHMFLQRKNLGFTPAV